MEMVQLPMRGRLLVVTEKGWKSPPRCHLEVSGGVDRTAVDIWQSCWLVTTVFSFISHQIYIR